MAIPCHLIAGALGVGKTTAIRRFVAQSPDYTAVLVNDFGETGYDAAFIAEAGGEGKLRVENVPGGCICCSSADQLLPALETLSKKPEVRRIIIEPSGLALLDPLLDMLREAAPGCGLELAPVIVLFDPVKCRPAVLKLIPYWRHFVEHAGIAVINRSDLAPPQAVELLREYLENQNPPKLKVVATSHGILPPEIFDLRGVNALQSHAQHVHHHAELPYAGCFRSEKTFRITALIELLEGLAPKLERFKGVFCTDDGWVRLEIAAGCISRNSAKGALRTTAEWIGADSSIISQLDDCRA